MNLNTMSLIRIILLLQSIRPLLQDLLRYYVQSLSGNSSIIDRDYRIKVNAVSSYLLSNHIAVDIMDRDTYIIKADRINSIFEGITCKSTPHEIKQLIS